MSLDKILIIGAVLLSACGEEEKNDTATNTEDTADTGETTEYEYMCNGVDILLDDSIHGIEQSLDLSFSVSLAANEENQSFIDDSGYPLKVERLKTICNDTDTPVLVEFSSEFASTNNGADFGGCKFVDAEAVSNVYYGVYTVEDILSQNHYSYLIGGSIYLDPGQGVTLSSAQPFYDESCEVVHGMDYPSDETITSYYTVNVTDPM